MPVIINGHTLTTAERVTLDAVLAYMHKFSGDSWWSSGTSPKGDGRWVPITEIFSARNNQANAQRRTVARLGVLGVLGACEIHVSAGCLRGAPTPAAQPSPAPHEARKHETKGPATNTE